MLRRPAVRKVALTFFTGIGLFCIGLGVIGAFVPLMPSTVFLIVAAWFLARGNPKLYRRLHRHPLFAPVRDWQAGRGLSTTTKVVAVSSVILSFSLSTVFVVQPMFKVLLAGFALGLSIYLLWQPTSKSLCSERPDERRDLVPRQENAN